MTANEAHELDTDFPYSDDLMDTVIAAAYRLDEDARSMLAADFGADPMTGHRRWTHPWRQRGSSFGPNDTWASSTPGMIGQIRRLADRLAEIARETHQRMDDAEQRARAEITRDRTWRR